MAEFRSKEVVDVVKNMAPLKTSGMDDFPALFFQKYWRIVVEVTQYCLDALNRRKDIGVVNCTSIVLNPKISETQDMSQFWPISLCNVIYKVISKIVVNRFRLVIGRCIDEAQAACVKHIFKNKYRNMILYYSILEFGGKIKNRAT